MSDREFRCVVAFRRGVEAAYEYLDDEGADAVEFAACWGAVDGDPFQAWLDEDPPADSIDPEWAAAYREGARRVLVLAGTLPS